MSRMLSDLWNGFLYSGAICVVAAVVWATVEALNAAPDWVKLWALTVLFFLVTLGFKYAD